MKNFYEQTKEEKLEFVKRAKESGEIVSLHVTGFSPKVTYSLPFYKPTFTLLSTSKVVAKIISFDDETVTFAGDTIWDFGITRHTVDINKLFITEATDEEVSNVFGSFENVRDPEYYDQIELYIAYASDEDDNDDFESVINPEHHDVLAGCKKRHEHYYGITTKEAIDIINGHIKKHDNFRWYARTKAGLFNYYYDEIFNDFVDTSRIFVEGDEPEDEDEDEDEE